MLAGQVPHRDFDDIYTGALAYLHAAFFAIGSHRRRRCAFRVRVRAALGRRDVCDRTALRAAGRRGIAGDTALVWSVPNYPASLPSWFNLFFATFGTLALLRGLETGRRRWLFSRAWRAGSRSCSSCRVSSTCSAEASRSSR